MHKITRFGIVAGNHREYIHYLEQLALDSKDYLIKRPGDPSEIDGIVYFYVSSEFTLRGKRGYDLIYYGTWMNRDYEVLESIAADYKIERLSRA